MHILPKSFTKSRCYGGYHGSKREDYLAQCRSLLPNVKAAETEPPSEPAALEPAADNPPLPKCPRCDVELVLVTSRPRPSWKDVFGSRSYSTHPTVLPVDGIGRHSFPTTDDEPFQLL